MLRHVAKAVVPSSRVVVPPRGFYRSGHYSGGYGAQNAVRADGTRRCNSTNLGAYLEKCGATWGDTADVHQVTPDDSSRSFSWQVDLPADTLGSLSSGDHLESPSFIVRPGSRARFQLFPKGDDSEVENGPCALWLWTDCNELGPVKLRVGDGAERQGGASDFCDLKAALNGGDSVKVSLQLEDPNSGAPVDFVENRDGRQSLQLNGLELAQWQVFNVRELASKGDMHMSPPFRFHHVLLGDMYLEILFENGLSTLFFRCRTPNVRLQVGISVGDTFSKSFMAVGRNTHQADLKASQCLQVNLDAPGVVGPDGSLKVRCALEQVSSIPNALRDMIPKLDERALWPKRL